MGILLVIQMCVSKRQLICRIQDPLLAICLVSTVAVWVQRINGVVIRRYLFHLYSHKFTINGETIDSYIYIVGGGLSMIWKSSELQLGCSSFLYPEELEPFYGLFSFNCCVCVCGSFDRQWFSFMPVFVNARCGVNWLSEQHIYLLESTPLLYDYMVGITVGK